MLRPTLEEAAEIIRTSECRVMPISMEMYADVITPIELLKILKNGDEHCFMLESAEDSKGWGRYTFLGFDPIAELTCVNGIVKIRQGEKETAEAADPDTCIRKMLDDSKSIRFDYLPPFTGGLVGYFSYEYARYSEPSLEFTSNDDEGFNDADLMLFDKLMVFDHYRQKIILIANIRTDNLKEEYLRGSREINRMMNMVISGTPFQMRPAKLRTEFRELFTKEEFCGMVRKAKECIQEGEIFQAVLSNRIEADADGDLLAAYRTLRTTNPSPYMFYIGGHDIEVAGSSPETLMKLENGKLYTYPLAGTRRRGATEEEDMMLEKELLSDEKELAEHNMLVDLGRNDIGKVSKAGTVKVENYLSVLRFSHVMHIGSTVSGELSEDKDGMDALNAIMPAGTLSGAPKIRAMQIIDRLEGKRRGIYGGAIGYLDLTGNVDTCIAIRIAYKKNGKVYVRAGAGIVADSIPENEYQECVNKMKAVRNALEGDGL